MIVPIRCLCPPLPDGTPRHEGDTVELRDVLTFRQASSIRNDARFLRQTQEDTTLGEYVAALTEGYILQGVESWSLVDARGKPLEPSRGNIRAVLLTDYEEAEKVANAADDLYSERVVLPLLAGASTSSPDMPTTGSTSPTTSTGSTPRKRSSRSSTSTTPTAGTGTTSARPDGGSRPSLSSVSAA